MGMSMAQWNIRGQLYKALSKGRNEKLCNTVIQTYRVPYARALDSGRNVAREYVVVGELNSCVVPYI